MRDPRHDPVPGDVLLQTLGRERHRLEVVEVDDHGVHFLRVEGRWRRECSTTLEAWRRWMADCEVVP